MCMKLENLLKISFCGLVLWMVSVPSYAVSAITTVNVTVARYLSITNASSLEFGNISVSATAGTVVINTNGMRFATGGVTINPTGSFNEAKFIIEGKPNANFAIKLPYKIELRDGNGNIINVNNFKSSTEAGTLDTNGVQEISVGGQINLDPNQATGDYTGTMIVELNYS